MSSKGVIPNLRPDSKKSPLNHQQISQLKCEAQERRQIEAISNVFNSTKLITPLQHPINSLNSTCASKTLSKNSYNLMDDSITHSFSETTPTPPSDTTLINGLTRKTPSLPSLESFSNFKTNVLGRKCDGNDYYPCLGLEMGPPKKTATVVTSASAQGDDAIVAKPAPPQLSSTLNSTIPYKLSAADLVSFSNKTISPILPKLPGDKDPVTGELVGASNSFNNTLAEYTRSKRAHTSMIENGDQTPSPSIEQFNDYASAPLQQPTPTFSAEKRAKLSLSQNSPFSHFGTNTWRPSSKSSLAHDELALSDTISTLKPLSTNDSSQHGGGTMSEQYEFSTIDLLDNTENLEYNMKNDNNLLSHHVEEVMEAEKEVISQTPPDNSNTNLSPISPGSMLIPTDDKNNIQHSLPPHQKVLSPFTDISPLEDPAVVSLPTETKVTVESNHNLCDNDSLFTERSEQLVSAAIDSCQDNDSNHLNMNEFVDVKTPLGDNDVDGIFNFFSSQPSPLKSDNIFSQLASSVGGDNENQSVECDLMSGNQPSLVLDSNLDTAQPAQMNLTCTTDLSASIVAQYDNSDNNLLNDCFSLVMGGSSSATFRAAVADEVITKVKTKTNKNSPRNAAGSAPAVTPNNNQSLNSGNKNKNAGSSSTTKVKRAGSSKSTSKRSQNNVAPTAVSRHTRNSSRLASTAAIAAGVIQPQSQPQPQQPMPSNPIIPNNPESYAKILKNQRMIAMPSSFAAQHFQNYNLAAVAQQPYPPQDNTIAPPQQNYHQCNAATAAAIAQQRYQHENALSEAINITNQLSQPRARMYPQNLMDAEAVQRWMSNQSAIQEDLRQAVAMANIHSSQTRTASNNNAVVNENQVPLPTNANAAFINHMLQVFKNDLQEDSIVLNDGITVPRTTENFQLYCYLKQLVFVIVTRNSSGSMMVADIRSLVKVLYAQLQVPHISIDSHKMAIYNHILALLNHFCDSCENPNWPHPAAPPAPNNNGSNLKNNAMPSSNGGNMMSVVHPGELNTNAAALARQDVGFQPNVVRVPASYVHAANTQPSMNNPNVAQCNANMRNSSGVAFGAGYRTVVAPSEGFVFGDSQQQQQQQQQQQASSSTGQQFYSAGVVNELLQQPPANPNQLTHQQPSYHRQPAATNNDFQNLLDRDQALAALQSLYGSSVGYNANQMADSTNRSGLNNTAPQVVNTRSSANVPGKNAISQTTAVVSGNNAYIPNHLIQSDSYNQAQQIAQLIRQQQLKLNENNRIVMQKNPVIQRLVSMPNNTMTTSSNAANVNLQNMQYSQTAARTSAPAINEYQSVSGGGANHQPINSNMLQSNGNSNRPININQVYSSYVAAAQKQQYQQQQQQQQQLSNNNSFLSQNPPANQQYHLNRMVSIPSKDVMDCNESMQQANVVKTYIVPGGGSFPPNNPASAYNPGPMYVKQPISGNAQAQFSTAKNNFLIPNQNFVLNNTSSNGGGGGGGLPPSVSVDNAPNNASGNNNDIYLSLEMKQELEKELRNRLSQNYLQRTAANVGGLVNMPDSSHAIQAINLMNSNFVGLPATHPQISANMVQNPQQQQHQQQVAFNDPQLFVRAPATLNNYNNNNNSNFCKPIASKLIKPTTNASADNYNGVVGGQVFLPQTNPPFQYDHQYGGNQPSPNTLNNLQLQSEYETNRLLKHGEFINENYASNLSNSKRLENFVNQSNGPFFQ